MSITCLRRMQRVSWVKQTELHLGYFVCNYLRLCSVTFRAASNTMIISCSAMCFMIICSLNFLFMMIYYFINKHKTGIRQASCLCQAWCCHRKGSCWSSWSRQGGRIRHSRSQCCRKQLHQCLYRGRCQVRRSNHGDLLQGWRPIHLRKGCR